MVLVDVVPLRGMYAIVSGDAVTKLGVDEGGCDPSSAMTIESIPRNAYVFSKEILGDNDEAKWDELSGGFNLPSLATNKICFKGNGHFGCETSFDKGGKLKTCIKDVRGMLPDKERNEPPDEKAEETSLDEKGNKKKSYIWHEMTFFTRWTPGSCIMLCINTPKDMQQKLEALLANDSTALDLDDPFSMYIPVLDEIVKLYETSVWAVRDVLRPIEKERDDRKADFNADFSQLQEILRHSLHVGEAISVTVGTTKDMRKCRRKILHRNSGNSGDDTLLQDKTHYHMAFQTQLIQNFSLRQQSNQNRLQTEITLAFNTITQQDSKVLKGDSKAMKTIAFLTMVFLPATFTSAIFSTSFFNFSPDKENENEKWRMSRKIYIFGAMAVFLTGVTMLVWYLWQYREAKDFKKLSKDVEAQKHRGGEKS